VLYEMVTLSVTLGDPSLNHPNFYILRCLSFLIGWT